MFPLRIELRTFRVLSGCDNHYTTETPDKGKGNFIISSKVNIKWQIYSYVFMVRTETISWIYDITMINCQFVILDAISTNDHTYRRLNVQI